MKYTYYWIATFIIILVSGKLSKAQEPAAISYPRTAGYMSIVHPIVSVNKDKATYNFSGTYTVGFPCGVNILKSDRAGFSFEVTPFITATGGTSKVSNFLFHPGVRENQTTVKFDGRSVHP